MTMVLAPNKAAAKLKESGGDKGKSDKRVPVDGEEGVLTAPLADSLNEAVEDMSVESAESSPEPVDEQNLEEGKTDAEA